MDILKVISGLIIGSVVIYIAFVLAGTLFTTFGVFSAIGFIIRVIYSLKSGESLGEPRVILFIFGFSIISGVVGMIFFQTALPMLMKGEWMAFGVALFVMALIYFGFREQLTDAWKNKN